MCCLLARLSMLALKEAYMWNNVFLEKCAKLVKVLY